MAFSETSADWNIPESSGLSNEANLREYVSFRRDFFQHFE